VLTEIIREALKDKKPIADKSSTEGDHPDVKEKEEKEDKEDLKSRSKI